MPLEFWLTSDQIWTHQWPYEAHWHKISTHLWLQEQWWYKEWTCCHRRSSGRHHDKASWCREVLAFSCINWDQRIRVFLMKGCCKWGWSYTFCLQILMFLFFLDYLILWVISKQMAFHALLVYKVISHIAQLRLSSALTGTEVYFISFMQYRSS